MNAKCHDLTECATIVVVTSQLSSEMRRDDTTVAIPDEVVGRRERKKAGVERALIDAAVELFHRRGLDETTVGEITDAVDVSCRTFHRYFATKDDVLFADAEARRRRIEQVLTARPSEESVLRSLRFVAHQLTKEFVENAEFERRRNEILRSHPRLLARRAHQSELWGSTLTAWAAARLGVGADDPLPALLGASTTTIARLAIERWTDDSSVDVVALVDRCFDQLQHLEAAVAGARSVASDVVVTEGAYQWP